MGYSQNGSRNNWLAVAGVGVTAVSVLHVGIVLAGAKAYQYFGAGNLVPLLEKGSWVPAGVTLAIAAVFGFFAFCAFRASRPGQHSRLLRNFLLFLGAVHALRGLLFFFELYLWVTGKLRDPHMVVFSLVSLGIGFAFIRGALALKR